MPNVPWGWRATLRLVKTKIRALVAPNLWNPLASPPRRASTVGTLDTGHLLNKRKTDSVLPIVVLFYCFFFFFHTSYWCKKGHDLLYRKGRSRFTTLGLKVINMPSIFLCAHVWYNGWDVITTQVLPKCLKKSKNSPVLPH